METKYYSLDKILKYDVPYRIIIGERSNGKTYSVKSRCIDKYKRREGKFMYLRRTHDQITRPKMQKLFEDINDYALDVLESDIQYANESGFYIDLGNGRETIGWCTSIEDCYKMKGIPFNEITTIFYDEFLEIGSRIEQEVTLFLHIISTIVRKRSDIEIFMVANTVTQYSPYFDLFGIDVKKIKQGEIYYIHHNAGAECAIERCASLNIINGVKSKNKYIGFDDNPTANMILFGEWEYNSVNTKSIDGIGWSCKRMLIPVYITALGDSYELSLYVSDNPILFVRKVNTQDGLVSVKIKYNLSYDNSVILTNKKEIVPTYGKLNKLVDKNVLNQCEIMKLCVQAKRVVFDSIATGSDFLSVFQPMM